MSNLIKSFSYVSLDEIRKIEAAKLELSNDIEREPSDEYYVAESQVQNESSEQSLLLKDQIMKVAEQEARELVRTAEEEAEKLLGQAKAEAAVWWEEQRRKDADIHEQSRQSGYEAGFEQGRQEAEHEMRKQYESLIADARTLLEQAHESARQIVGGAEPFLLELGSRIAEKIIGRQLELSPEWAIDMIRHALKRSGDKGTIALCVSPSRFAYIQSVRDELTSSIDAQAELIVLPDSTVMDHGCVIKTSFGSIDARIETQLTEIKEALIDLCKRGDELRDE